MSAAGLDFAPPAARRCTIACIHNAPGSFSEALVGMWGQKTAEEAHDILVKPDVRVTNQKDKEVQLPKLRSLNEFAKRAAADVAADSAVAIVGGSAK